METTTENLGNQINNQIPRQSKSSKRNLAREKRTMEKLKILRKERFNIAKAIKGRETLGKNDPQTLKLYEQLGKTEKKIPLVNSSRVPTFKTNNSIIKSQNSVYAKYL